MPGTPGARFGLAAIADSDFINAADTVNGAQLAILEAHGVRVDRGTLSARPTSTVGTPGITDRIYYATDTQALYYDTGIGWIYLGSIDVGWQAIPYSGIYGDAGAVPGQYRVTAGRCYVRGDVGPSSGSVAQNDVVGVLPAAARPATDEMVIFGFSKFGNGNMTVSASTGHLTVLGVSATTSTIVLSFSVSLT